MHSNYENKEVFIFDLDGTLALSKSSIDSEMSKLLSTLLQIKKVAVISGGALPQFIKQIVEKLEKDVNLRNLILLPVSGTQMYTYDDDWKQIYSDEFLPEESVLIVTAINEALKHSGITRPEQVFGEIIEDRGSQITFSALGQNAPLDLKIAWDPDRSKRKELQSIIQDLLPNFDVGIGGSTSIDITRKGVNKQYGIHKISSVLSIPIEEMVFVGDAIFPDGNDYPAKESGIDCISVNSPEDTKKFISDVVALRV